MSSSAPVDASDLQQALDGRFPYHLLSASLQQRMTPQEYHRRTVHYSILRWHAYHRLPDFVMATLTEKAYYTAMIEFGGEQLQLYPYVHQKQILFYTNQTPLSYYSRMVAELLKAERSYDRLPNFTANDILLLLGIGRNQYLNVTKEVRGKLRWHVNRNYVVEHLPKELLPTVALDPFWVIVPVVEAAAQLPGHLEAASKLCRSDPADVTLLRMLATKGRGGGGAPASPILSSSFARGEAADDAALAAMGLSRRIFASDAVYACQLPRDAVHRLYHKALVCADFCVSPSDLLVVPPLGNFVMNRTSDEPLELLLYRVLSTLDDRTPLQLLAQLLMVPEEDVCAAVLALVRLGLARGKHSCVPAVIDSGAEAVHPSWADVVAPLLAQHRQQAAGRSGSMPARLEDDDGDADLPITAAASATDGGAEGEAPRSVGASPAEAAPYDGGVLEPPSPPAKRIALLYDATLTGFLMMTNLSRDPVFKQHAVTLFEVGKMPDEMVDSFLEMLEKLNTEEALGFGGEALKYISSAISLREVLKVLRAVPTPEGERSGVDLLKLESLNELEATTRYSVLGRNYWAFITTAPIATAPYLDVELSCIYGNTASLIASPWLLLHLYEKLGEGPPTVMLPFGSQLHCWPPEFHACEEPPAAGGAQGSATAAAVEGFAAKARVQTVALDAEVSYADMDSSLLLANGMAVTAPVLVQCVAPVPLVALPGRRDGAVGEAPGYRRAELAIPFTATAEDALYLLQRGVSSGASAGDSGGEATTSGPAQFDDDGAAVFRAVERCVAALQLQDSLGYVNVCVSFHPETGVNATPPPPGDAGARFVVTRVDVVGIGLGLPLVDVECCACAVRELPRLLTVEASDRHTAAMRACVREFSAFLEQYTTLTQSTYSALPLQSTTITGPMTQQHLRKVGGAAVPFPSTTVVFDGCRLYAVDDADPLTEQWSI